MRKTFGLFLKLGGVLFTLFATSTSFAFNHSIEKSGQFGWSHDEGFAAGYFHTYDNLKVAGANDIPRKIHIFLPKNYEESQEKYPVVYMNNGDISFFSNSLNGSQENLNVAEAVGKINKRGRSYQPIVVSIYPLNPEFEYTLTGNNNTSESKNCCGVEAYANYVADHVKRFVDNNYRTLRSPENTTVLGVSTGANAALLQLALRPDAFLNVAAISPPIWRETTKSNFSNSTFENSQFAKTLKYTFENHSSHFKVYLDWGASSLQPTSSFFEGSEEQRTAYSARFLKDYLIEKYGLVEGQNIEWQEDASGIGTVASWSQRIYFALTPFIKWR